LLGLLQKKRMHCRIFQCGSMPPINRFRALSSIGALAHHL